MAMQYTAEFQPQAWVNDYAINVDPEGPTTWDVTAHVTGLDDAARKAVMVPDDYPSDYLRDLPNAPQWVKDWAGPFYITVTHYPEE